MKRFLHFRQNHGPVLILWAIGLMAMLASGCHTDPKLPKYITQFYLEAPGQSGVAFTLPISQLTYHRMADSFLDLSEVTGVEQAHVTVNLPDGTAEQKSGVIFYFSDDGRYRLNIASGSNQRQRIFLFLNEKPVGVHFIDQTLDGGQLFMFFEVPDKDLPDYVVDLKESIKRLKDLKNK